MEEPKKEDVFRRQYKPMKDETKTFIDTLKAKAEELYGIIEQSVSSVVPGNGREIALAKTKLEESIMWAVKGITK